MARGALAAFDALIAVSVTGIAGPGGGSELKPVGLVWFAAAHSSGRIILRRGFYPGRSRKATRERAALSAMELLVRELKYELA
jgi:PncC family amidohydrolase